MIRLAVPLACLVLIFLCHLTFAGDEPAPMKAGSLNIAEHPWAFAEATHRIGIRVEAGDHPRIDRPVSVDLALPEDAETSSLRLIEVDASGKTMNGLMLCQFDAAPAADAGGGTLTFMLAGRTEAKAVRIFHLYMGGPEPRAAGKPMLRVEDDVEHQGQKSYRITTPLGVWVYHKQGAGFASLFDTDDRDWISYRPGNGPAGEYRGIPNLVHPEGHFHPGGKRCESTLLASGPLRVVIASKSSDDQWACRWDIYPTHATLTVLKAPKPYWFLYEGTPGGKLDLKTDFCLRPGDRRTSAEEKWEQRDGDRTWVAFGDAELKRVLYIWRHQADEDTPDTYWPMHGAMTVMGLGRRGTQKFLQTVPARYTVGFSAEKDLPSTLDSHCRDVAVAVSEAQARP